MTRKTRNQNTGVFNVWSICGFIFALLIIEIPYLMDNVVAYKYCIRLARVAFMLLWLVVMMPSGKAIMKEFRLLLFLLALGGIIVINTVFNDGNVGSALSFAFSLLSIPLFFLPIRKDCVFKVIKGITFYFRIVLTIYLATVFIYSGTGLYNYGLARKYYLWGHVNSSIKMALPAIALFSVLDLKRRGRLSLLTWIYTILVLITQIYTESYVAAAGIVVYCGTLLLYIVYPRWIRIVPNATPMIVALGLFFVICVLNSQRIFQAMYLFANNAGRGSSISSRAIIWQQGIDAIRKKPTGYGWLTDFSSLIRIGTYLPSSAHNLFLDVNIQAGILGCVILVVFFFLIQRKMPAWREWPVIPAVLFSYAVMWNFEPYFSLPHFYCIIILFYIFFVLNYQNMLTS